jgi:hypothetical protein
MEGSDDDGFDEQEDEEKEEKKKKGGKKGQGLNKATAMLPPCISFSRSRMSFNAAMTIDVCCVSHVDLLAWNML